MKTYIKLKNLILILIVAMLIGISLSCGNSSSPGVPETFIVFSDVHFDPFYDPSPTLFWALVSAEASEWDNIFKTSSVTAPPVLGSDTNYPLFVLALTSINQHLGSSPFLIFTGDILSHKFAKTFYERYGSPSTPGPSDIAAMQSFADKTVAFFLAKVRASAGTIPVLFAVGNNDSYNDQGPDSTFLASNAGSFYANCVSGITNQATFNDTFLTGGYYSADVPGTNMTVVSLNTIVFSPPPDGNTSVSGPELTWLDSTLASAQARGKKVWLLIHIPPGAKILETSRNVDSSGQITPATTVMMWDQDVQATFLGILSKYPDLITLKLGGHTHMDEYRIIASNNVLNMTPGITSYSNNNPAYKIFTFTSDTLQATDYSSMYYDLATNPAQFNSFYTFSTSFPRVEFLDSSLVQLWPDLATDNSKQAPYRAHYYSGSASSTTDITTTNWPVFWSGIGNMPQQNFIDAVNGYTR